MAIVQVPAVQAGGMTLLSTTALSGTSVTISGISGSYTNLQIYIKGLTTTSNIQPRFRPNGNNPVFTVGEGTGSSKTSDGSFNAGGVGTSLQNYVFTIFNYADSTDYKPINLCGYYVAQTQGIIGGGASLETSAITSLVFATGTAATFTTGSILIYGVK